MSESSVRAYLHPRGASASRIEIRPTTLLAYSFPVFLIGSDPRCHLVVRDVEVAPVHALIARSRSGEFVIRRVKPDLSLNVDGEAVEMSRLHDNSIIRIGRTVLNYRVGDAAPAPVAVTPEPEKPKHQPKKQSRFSAATIMFVLAGMLAAIPVVVIMQRLPAGIEAAVESWDSFSDDFTSLVFEDWKNSGYEEEFGNSDNYDSSFSRGGPTMMRASDGRVALLYFEADWCSYCRRQRPVIDDLQNNYYGYLDVMIIDTDDPDNYDLVYEYNVTVLPTMIMVDDQGYVVSKHYGYTGWNTLAQAVEATY